MRAKFTTSFLGLRQENMLQTVAGICIAGLISLKGLKSNLTIPGALTAFILGSLLFSHSAGMGISLIVMYFTASKATKYKSDLKTRIQVHQSNRGSVQVICVGILPLAASLLYSYTSYKFDASILSLVSLAVGLGDTLASELGSVLSTTPILISTLKVVPPGTNGAVSLGGTIISGIGGTIMGLSYTLSRYFFPQDLVYLSFTRVLIIGTTAGLLGSFIDSVLGATVQVSLYDPKTKLVVEKLSSDTVKIAGVNILSNELVNLTSTLLTCLIYYIFSEYI
jgi:uncharacterized protein (TIGR00297 family)